MEDVDDTLRREGRWEGELIHMPRAAASRSVVASRQAVHDGEQGEPPGNAGDQYRHHPAQAHATGPARQRGPLPPAGRQRAGLRDLSAVARGPGSQLERGRATLEGVSARRDSRPAIHPVLSARGCGAGSADGAAGAGRGRGASRGRRLAGAQGRLAVLGRRRSDRAARRKRRAARLRESDARSDGARGRPRRPGPTPAARKVRVWRPRPRRPSCAPLATSSPRSWRELPKASPCRTLRAAGVCQRRRRAIVRLLERRRAAGGARPRDLESIRDLRRIGRAVARRSAAGPTGAQGRSVPEMLVRFRVLATGEERWSLVGATRRSRTAEGQAQLAVTIFRDVTERRRAEETAQFMAAASAELAGSLEFELTLRRVAQLAVPTLADWCVVDVIDDDGQLRRLAAAHVDPAKSELATGSVGAVSRGPVGDHRGCARAAYGAARVDDRDFGRTAAAPGRAMRNIWPFCARCSCARSSLCRSLRADGRWARSRSWRPNRAGATAPHELAVAQDLAVRAALAADNARLYREAQQQAAIHVQLNAALHDAMAQLQQALLTRDEFLASASHDLKNPIASIKASAQLLQRRLRPGGQLDRRANSTRSGAHRHDRHAGRGSGGRAARRRPNPDG